MFPPQEDEEISKISADNPFTGGKDSLFAGEIESPFAGESAFSGDSPFATESPFAPESPFASDSPFAGESPFGGAESPFTPLENSTPAPG